MWVQYLPNLHSMLSKSVWDMRIICENFEAWNRGWQNMEQLWWHLRSHLGHMPWKFSPAGLQVIFFHFRPASSSPFFVFNFTWIFCQDTLSLSPAFLVIHFHFHFPHQVDIVHCSLWDSQLQKRLHSKARELIKINLGALMQSLTTNHSSELIVCVQMGLDWMCTNGPQLIKLTKDACCHHIVTMLSQGSEQRDVSETAGAT